MTLYPNFHFTYTQPHTSSAARLGKITTPHGIVETPAFIFCATKASLKSLPIANLQNAHTQIILSNTYHLMLQPGADVIEKLGSLHKFMGWSGPMLTDSGGFQIFSLGHGSVAGEIKGRLQQHRPKTLLKITEEGATFKSYTDGALHFLTPEKSIEVQHKLGADLVVVLDECTPFHVEKSYTKSAMERSHRWEERSLRAFGQLNQGTQALYGIIQGGVYEDLRKESAHFVNTHPFFGHAIGGSLGAHKQQMYDIVNYTMDHLVKDRAIHLLGIGGVSDIFKGVAMGIDTFDCVHPTRLARHGGALIKGDPRGHINLRNACYVLDESPLDPSCNCSTCQTYSRGYIHHLLKAKELLAYTLLTEHNVFYMNRLFIAIRRAIQEGTLEQARYEWLPFE